MFAFRHCPTPTPARGPRRHGGARARVAIAIAVAAGAALAAPARAGAHGPRLSGDVRQVVAIGDRVAALRGDDVVVLDGGSVVVGGLLARDRAPDLAPARRPHGLGSDEVIDLAGLPDDDLESDAVEEALDDEGVAATAPRARWLRGRARGRRNGRDGRPGAAGGPRALAAGAQAIWVAGGGGLRRIDAGGPAGAAGPVAARVGPRDLAVDAIAAAETAPVLAVLSGDKLMRSGDGGASWMLVAVLESPAHAVAVSRDGGDLFVLDDEGVAQVAHRERMAVGPGRARHLARCGDDLMILTDDGLYAWRWDRGAERRSGPLPARWIGCSPAAPGVVLAAGGTLLASTDGGRTWNQRDDLPVAEVHGAAIGGGRLWVATAAGLFDAPVERPDAPAAGAGAAGAMADRDAGARSGAPEIRPRNDVWPALLPRVSLVLVRDVITPGSRRGVVLLLLTFPLGRARRAIEAAGVARDLQRRRAAAAAELARLAASDQDDGEAAAERRALLDSLEDLR